MSQLVRISHLGSALRCSTLSVFLAVSLASTIGGVLHVFENTWQVLDLSDWQVEGAGADQILHLLVGREPPADQPRRPFQFAIAQTYAFDNVIVTADVRPHGRSLMIVYAYRDSEHFNYAHLSTDTAGKQPHHNGIFHVYGGERVRISTENGPPAFAGTDRWYHVALTWNGRTGECNVTVDGTRVDALHAVDTSLTSGRIGLGSFDETGDFRNVRIQGH